MTIFRTSCVALVAMLSAIPAVAATRDFAKPCNELFPVASSAMTSSGFAVKTSDAAGGILAMEYAGQPLAYSFFFGKADPLIAKYVEGGDRMKKKFRGVSFTAADFAFIPHETGCRVNLSIGIAGINIAADTRNAKWDRTGTALASNGTAESEALDKIERTMQDENAR
jgi:hypothetical protein